MRRREMSPLWSKLVDAYGGKVSLLAQAIGVSESTLRRWYQGTVAVPKLGKMRVREIARKKRLESPLR